MAAPNILNASNILGKTTYLTPANTTDNVLVANAASSGKVLKINGLIAANIDGSSLVNTSVFVNSKADASGTSYAVVSTVAVPANASLIVIDKGNSIYLEEDKSIVVKSGTSSKIAYTVSYEEIS